ncbi:hypothetical protein ACFO0S_13205 [Chryseomicrobium palamuruense]|uniref:Uncharacterized protein n=1 Tax=Chryseomicrobium palamuruense TaxID=682973 RepID=A0ABV8UZP7_9BACL
MWTIFVFFFVHFFISTYQQFIERVAIFKMSAADTEINEDRITSQGDMETFPLLADKFDIFILKTD